MLDAWPYIFCKLPSVVDRLPIILHTNACDVGVFCAVSCKVSAGSIYLCNAN